MTSSVFAVGCMPLLAAAWGLTASLQYRDMAVIFHPVVRSVSPSDSPDGLIILPHECLPLIPTEEARAMHCGVGEPPQRVVRVGNKVRGRYDVVAFIKHDPADGALCLAE
jgi:hypothetical protein